jgi:dCTP deaminase
MPPAPPPFADTAPTSSGAPRGILVDHELEALFGRVLCPPDDRPIEPHQLQPASVDLRLGARVHVLRCGFLPERASMEDRLAELALDQMSLEGDGALLHPGLIYLVELEEQLALDGDLAARFNPRSSTGRCDLFCRVLVPGHPRFDEAPPGYNGRLWLEIVPLSFPVRLKRGDRLVQARLARGSAAVSREELAAFHARSPLGFEGERPLELDELRIDEEGAVELRVGLEGRDPAGWRARLNTGTVRFAAEGAHARDAYFEPVHAQRGPQGTAYCVLDPGRFYIFASRERLVIPPELAAEMLPVDVGFGELRNNYAGFFDNGFGWSENAEGEFQGHGTPAVLEVRAHDVPFLVEDGQIFFRLRFYRATGRPRNLYGQGRPGRSYRDQDLTLARPFS